MQSLLAPPQALDGRLERASEFQSRAFSQKIFELLRWKWEKSASFRTSGPILIGSAARDELCPRSDLDLIFVGSESAGADFVRDCQEQGLRLRSRFPADLSDWTLGVDEPDLLALLDGRALFPEHESLLEKQKLQILDRSKKERKAWLQVLRKERQKREERFNSIANVLEPNLKYGPGGLRDLDQARQVLKLFPDRFPQGEADRATQVFAYYSQLWLLLRQKLHIDGQGDLFTGTAQFDLSRWFQIPHRDLMREVQRGLSRVHFYSNWIFAKAESPPAKLRGIAATSLDSPRDVLLALEKEPGILMQHRVRQVLSDLFPKSWIQKNPTERGNLLERVLRPGSADAFIQAVFQSRLIDRLAPEIKALVGLVQHDQYHRYTADVHLMQACREFQKTLKSPGRVQSLSGEVKELSPQDRKILGLAMLYHDLMKGREGDHSDEGTRLVRRDFQAFGWSETLSEEVGWLVQNHLLLSTAAFRKNPMSPETWAELQAAGAVGARLRRLAVFTAIDIFATNPEAWTPWKGRLLSDLLKALRSPTATSYLKLDQELKKRKLDHLTPLLDSYLISQVPAAKLALDLESRSNAGPSIDVFSVRGQDLWIRWFHPQDQVGFFAEAVRRLYGLGLSVKHASVHTLPDLGIYNWFQVSSRKTPAQIRQMLKLSADKTILKPLPEVQFDSVSFVSETDSEWMVSFKGKDQPGCLAVAAQAIADEGLSLKSARVHTWGRQVDDVFGIVPQGDAKELLSALQKRLQRR